MVHQIFDTSDVGFDDFFQIGAGGGFNGAGGMMENNDYYFKGSAPYQRGSGGIGDLFRGLWRFFLPIVRRVGTTVSAEALNTGQRALERIAEGEPVKSALITEGKRGIDTVLDKGGLPKQFGTGFHGAIKRNKIRKKHLIPSHQTIIGRAVTKPIITSKKRLRSDAFGLY